MKLLTNVMCKNFIELAVKRTAKYLAENDLDGITVGISGGIDSSVVADIGLKAVKELGENTGYDYVYLDCDSDNVDKKKAEALSKNLKFKLRKLNLTSWYKLSPLLKEVPKNHPRTNIAKGNIKCRLRMISLYHSTQLNNYVYLDTDDLSEEWMGFWTRHGDEGDIKIIQHVTKTELYDIGEYLKLPEIILKTKPGDGLKVTQGNMAEDQLGLDYIFIEYIISKFISEGFDINGSFDQLTQNKYKKLVKSVGSEIKEPIFSIEKVLKQSLKTAYKRKYGDYAPHLLPSRKQIGFPEAGTKEFNKTYLKAIREL